MLELSRSLRHEAETRRPAELPLPLVVSVDGALLTTDPLHEAAIRFAAANPLQLWRLPLWRLAGRERMKQMLLERTDVDPLSLPVRNSVQALIREAQSSGRPVFLATAGARADAEAVAVRLGGLAGIFAGDDTLDLSGEARAERLVSFFGVGGFDYIGSSADDLPVWRAAAHALALPENTGVERDLLDKVPAARILERPGRSAHDYLAALRPHQWAKNALILVPVVTSHSFDLTTLAAALIAFMSFCAAASAAYLLNDLVDLPADRSHPRKCSRPIASGRVPIPHAVGLAAILMLLAVGLAALLPRAFLATLGLYVGATCAYSLWLKREIVVDVVTLSLLYTVRVVAGTFAIGTPRSAWLLMFSVFLFLSLAIVKRCSELVMLRDGHRESMKGRGYRVADLPVMTALAAAAGYGAVLVFALYLSSPEISVLYSNPLWLWGGCPLLLAWTSRCILLAGRGELHDDPVVFALTDRMSHLLGLCLGGLILVAI